jgi:hypothetical protein
MNKAEKIRILFLAANPLGARYNFRIEEQVREIEDRIQRGSSRDSLELISWLAVRVSDLQQALLTYKPHIVHFTGYGRNLKGVVLENDLAEPVEVDKRTLTELFKVIRDRVRVVVLNACYAEAQAKALSEVIDVTIGMGEKVSKKAAVIFAAYFYQSLAFGRSVQESFDLAKIQLDLEKTWGAGKPVLLSRKGVDASKTFLVKDSSSHD